MSRGERRDASAASDPAEELRRAVRQLVLMKETGPKSAAWQRARVRAIWRLQQRLAALEQRDHRAADRPDAEHESF